MPAKRKAAGEKPLELSIAVKGEIVSSNFEDFKEFAEAQILAVSFDLKTDEDFAQADEDAKGLKKFEGTLTQAKADALAQMDELNSLLGSVDELGALARNTRLELERRVKARKIEVREGIIRDGIAALEVRNREFADMIGEAIKSKSSLVKMQEAVTEVVGKLNGRIRANREVYAKAKDEIGDAVAYGEDAFVTLTVEAAKVEMERRIERHRAAIKEAELKAEAERLRKEKEERDRLDRLAAQQEAEKAKQEAFAKAALENAGGPPTDPPADFAIPPAVKESLPTATAVTEPAGAAPEEEETEAEELARFQGIVLSALAPIREARALLVHPSNIERAQTFADAVGEAWKTFTKEGGQ